MRPFTFTVRSIAITSTWLAAGFVACGGAPASDLFKEASAGVGDDGDVIADAGPNLDGVAPDSGPKPKDAGPDAQPPSCADACKGIGTCQGNVCVIDCTFGITPCPAKVKCPKGVACKVVCGGLNSCGQGIDCSEASSCDLACSGTSACGPISCGGSACTVTCPGTSACGWGITCTASMCTIGCGGLSSCGQKVSCNGQQCGVSCNGLSSCVGGVCCTAKTCNVTGVPNGC